MNLARKCVLDIFLIRSIKLRDQSLTENQDGCFCVTEEEEAILSRLGNYDSGCQCLERT